jgi:hypothetical protein
MSLLQSFIDKTRFFIEIDFFCVSKLSFDLFFKLPVSRFLAINIDGKIPLEGLRPLIFFLSRHILRCDRKGHRELKLTNI